MHEGYLLDVTYGNRNPVFWVEGPPEPSPWVGLKLKGREVRQVETYRCTRCGYLQSYARLKKP